MAHNVQHSVTVTGVPAQGGAQPNPYPRRPIEELVTDQKQFSLYVQATAAMQSTTSQNMLSWFQVSGIHGLPETPWDNVAGINNPPWVGYCTHSSVLFPTWHRPYVLLFEQALVAAAQNIANKYTGADAAEWQQAAAQLRSPYWDWAVNDLPPPEVIELQTLTVTGPNGPVTLNPNPLLSYHYQATDPRIDSRPQTVRCPSQQQPNKTDLQALKDSLATLSNPNDPMRDRVFNTLTAANTWEEFSNTRTSAGAFANSVESIHNTIHVLSGGNGQMGDPSYAGFDPLFFMHHTNVDRYIALWQALHPNVWVSAVTGNGEGGTFSMPRNSHVNENTSLTPFWNGPSTFWTSDGAVRDWTQLNYTYPEFLQVPAGANVQQAIHEAVIRLYQEDDDDVAPINTAVVPPAAPASHPAPAPPASHPAPAPQAPQAPIASHPAPAPPAAHAPAAPHPAPHAPVAQQHSTGQVHLAPGPHQAHTRLDWIAHVTHQAGAVDKSFTVLFFLGAPPAHEHDWRTSPNLIGLHSEFINSHPAACSNCAAHRQEGLVTEGFVRLSRSLRTHGVYNRPEHEIDSYLQENLQYRVQKVDGTIVDPATVGGIKVEVLSVPQHYSTAHKHWHMPATEAPRTRPYGRATA